MTAPAPPLLEQADDYREECRCLHDLLLAMVDNEWEAPTGFKHWTAIDIIGHLHLADTAAMAALDGAQGFAEAMAGFLHAIESGESPTAYTRHWHGLTAGPQLLARWWQFANRLADSYRSADPRRRIPWGRGPDMSARSAMGARQMEVWAHGQALVDLLAVDRPESDRLRNIAILGVNTFGWSFRVRGRDVPEPPPFIRLVAPSGAVWQWHDPAAASRVEGSAVEFCQVVTQTRNVADTRLELTGDVAQAWMANAQCFAGPPSAPPLPGSRGKTG